MPTARGKLSESGTGDKGLNSLYRVWGVYYATIIREVW